MATSRFHSSEIECEGCASAIKNSIGKLEGVTAVDVEVASKVVSVEHSDSISAEALTLALDRAGFPVD